MQNIDSRSMGKAKTVSAHSQRSFDFWTVIYLQPQSYEEKQHKLELEFERNGLAHVLLEAPNWQQLILFVCLFVFCISCGFKEEVPLKIGILSCFV